MSGIKQEIVAKCIYVLEKDRSLHQFLSNLLVQVISHLKDCVHKKCQQIQRGQGIRQMMGTMPKVMFQVVALDF